MNNALRTVVTTLAVLAFLGAAWPVAAQAEHYGQIQYAPLGDWKIPEPQRLALGNGMVLFLRVDHELPMIEVYAVIGAGSRLEPADKVGLTTLLNRECDPTEARHCTPLPTQHVMPSGPIPANPAEALTLPDMGDLLEMFRDQYDYVIVDTPPLLVVTDPGIVASLVDAVVLSIRIRRKSKPNAKESINILRAVGANVLGVVINNSDDVAASDGYRGYGYYRYGRYSKRYNVKDSNGQVTQKLGSSQVVVSGGASARIRQARTIDVKAIVNKSPELSTTYRSDESSPASVD